MLNWFNGNGIYYGIIITMVECQIGFIVLTMVFIMHWYAMVLVCYGMQWYWHAMVCNGIDNGIYYALVCNDIGMNHLPKACCRLGDLRSHIQSPASPSGLPATIVAGG
jgi:hypothetical protein